LRTGVADKDRALACKVADQRRYLCLLCLVKALEGGIEYKGIGPSDGGQKDRKLCFFKGCKLLDQAVLYRLKTR
jgi:hypothetical protein